MSARIAPLDEAELNDKQRELLAGMRIGGPTVNIFRTLVRHPRLFRHWTRFGGALLSGSIPEREREIVILRTGWLCRADYEWGQHVAIALRSGVTREEIDRIPRGAGAAGWSVADALLLRAVDELHVEHRIGDATWAALAQAFTTEQLIELPMLVGQYTLVAMTLNSLGVEREVGVEGLPG